ncbi:MAG: CBS domain-containing protein [Gammaproteobacteria bacterium]|nr:CBS domain-containing protein [Gammaproteobacteria bacterium]
MQDEPPSRQSILAAVRNWFSSFSKPAAHGRARLTEVLREAEAEAIIDADIMAMMEGALAVSEAHVADIMVPRAEIVAIEEDQQPADFLAAVIESGHSRFPMFDDKHEKVIGILLAKDLLRLVRPEPDTSPAALRDMLRPAVFVPESKRLSVLLREFRSNRNHLAIVVDEYGEVSGLVSIEDVLEQIVGEIGDETDVDDEEMIRRHREDRYTVRARTPVTEFNEYFDARLPEDEYDTVGGLVLQAFGALPGRGEQVHIGGYRFKVLRADPRRIHLLRVTPEAVSDEADGDHPDGQDAGDVDAGDPPLSNTG